MRRSLLPIANRLGLDYDLAFFAPPSTDEAMALDVFRCPQNLFMTLTYPETWTRYTPDPNRPNRRAGALAKRVRSAMLEPSGASAISYVAQGYATEMTAFFRRGIDGKDSSDAEKLMLGAERSEVLGAIAAGYWPVDDPLEVLSRVADAEGSRLYDPNNPDAMIDLLDYAAQTRVMCGAAALALGPDLDEFEAFVLTPVLTLEMVFAAQISMTWTSWLDAWTNLISDEPMAWVEIMRSD